MAINNVNTTSKEKSYKFLKNQSSILRTVSTNNITINGVNVIVAKPKVGDIMCVTRYKNNSDVLLPAEEQKVIWIDGLSIEPKQLSTEFEPVGICVVVNGDKAIVRYKEEFSANWIGARRYVIMNFNDITLTPSPITIKINNRNKGQFPNGTDTGSSLSKEQFVMMLNSWITNNSLTNYFSAQYENNSVIINTLSSVNTIELVTNSGVKVQLSDITNNHTEYISITQYGNNGFNYNTDKFDLPYNPFICSAAAYDILNGNNTNFDTTDNVQSINKLVNKNSFETKSYCQFLRNNFVDYNDYLNSLTIKYPCGAGSLSDNTKSGKDNTYKLANYTFINSNSEQKPLYPAAYLASNINVNGPNLTTGNWWIPSLDEMTQILSNITYGTTSWTTKPDIVNSVIEKVNNGIEEINKGNNEEINIWSALHPLGKNVSYNKWLPIKDVSSYLMFYNSYNSTIGSSPISFHDSNVMPITIYDI